MEPLSNGTTAEGSIVMTTTEMDQTFPDNQQLVGDTNQQDSGDDGPGSAIPSGGQKLGLGFGKKGCSRPTGGFAILVSATLVFSVAVTVALIIQIYLGPYEVGQYGGVATDVPQCSQIGVNILQKGGSAVDASIASLFCVGVINGHNSGIGGGGFMIIHDHKINATKVIDFRETAPASATKDMFKDNPADAEKGPRSVGIPGYLRGMDVAHKLYGRLPWKELIAPSIDIARTGFNVTQEIVLSMSKVSLDDFDGPLREIYVRDGEFVKLGDKIVQPDLADTLTIIAENGAESFYEGDLASSVVNATEGAITLEDLQSYKVVEREAIHTTYKNKGILTMPAPGGGPTLAMMLNIMEGFNWTAADKNNSVTYKRMIESFRFAYAQRPLLADPGFVTGVNNSVMTMIQKTEAAKIRDEILQYNGTKPPQFYLPEAYTKSTTGTSHVSAADSKELYVSVTGSINYLFGAKLMTSTGVQLNNHMADFDVPGVNNKIGLPPNQGNFPEPSKRPLSAMSPTIVYTLEKPCGLRVTIGASNGTRIISGVAETLVNLLSFDMSLEEAISSPRVHDQLFDNQTEFEDGLPTEIVNYLTDQGYKLHKITDGLSAVQAVLMNNETAVAVSDPRKWGEAAVLKNE